MDSITKRVPLLSNPYVLSGSVASSYILLYTAFDKKTKTLQFGNVLDLFLCRRGLDWTLVEANKALSLAGLTTMMIAYLPEFKEQRKDLLWISMVTLWGHSTYSFYKFYQFDIRKAVSEKFIKRISLLLGAASSLALAMGVFDQLTALVMAASTTALGIAHFYSMEIDYKYVLQVRPFAYLPFPLAGMVFYNVLTQKDSPQSHLQQGSAAVTDAINAATATISKLFKGL